MKSEDSDILIVGSGPAGVSTWLYLHKYAPELASRSVIIEKEKHPREKLCGGALLNPFVKKFLFDLNISLSVPKIDIDTVKVKRGEDSFTFNKESFISIINRSEFDSYLVDIARKRGANVFENEAFKSIKRDKTDLIVQTSKKDYNAKILVGADGALSKVRNSISLPCKISYAKTLEVFAPVDSNVDSEFGEKSIVLDWSCFNQNIQGYMWHFPCIVDGNPYMNHGISDSMIVPLEDKGNLKQFFRMQLEERDLDIPLTKWKSHPIPFFNGERVLSEENVLLVGDAAGIEPLIGGGIHLSLLYGDVAARSIISSFENDDFSFSEYTSRVDNHIVGKYINNSIRMAKQVYSEQSDLLGTIKRNLEMTDSFSRKESS